MVNYKPTMSDYSTTRLQDHRTEDDAITRCSQWSVVSSQLSSRESAFTLPELLVSMAVLVLLVLLFTQLLNSAATVTILGHKLMDADSEARQVFDRMAIDFAQMVKRTDVDYYVKGLGLQGNRSDQIAFYSAVPGYYPSSSAQSPLSLVAYRVNSDPASSSYNKLERMGKGLRWNGVSTTNTPAVFQPLTISATWPNATSTSAIDADYEVMGPDVFRFEYYFMLTNGDLYESPCKPTPCLVNGWRSVAAIAVAIAVIDPRSKVLLTDPQIATLNTGPGSNFLVDSLYIPGQMSRPGALLNRWQLKLTQLTTFPRPAVSGIRLYERYFYLPQ